MIACTHEALKDKSSPTLDDFNRKNKLFQTEEWKFDEHRIKKKEDMKL